MTEPIESKVRGQVEEMNGLVEEFNTIEIEEDGPDENGVAPLRAFYQRLRAQPFSYQQLYFKAWLEKYWTVNPGFKMGASRQDRLQLVPPLPVKDRRLDLDGTAAILAQINSIPTRRGIPPQSEILRLSVESLRLFGEKLGGLPRTAIFDIRDTEGILKTFSLLNRYQFLGQERASDLFEQATDRANDEEGDVIGLYDQSHGPLLTQWVLDDVLQKAGYPQGQSGSFLDPKRKNQSLDLTVITRPIKTWSFASGYQAVRNLVEDDRLKGKNPLEPLIRMTTVNFIPLGWIGTNLVVVKL